MSDSSCATELRRQAYLHFGPVLPPIPDISEVLSQRRVSSPLGITGERWDEPGYHRGNERRPGAPSRAAEHAFAARGIDLTAEQFDVTGR